MAPHSPLSAGFTRSHCGMKSPLMPPPDPSSVHGRVTLLARRLTGLFDDVTWLVSANENVPSPTRYLFTLVFTAVFPLPPTSHVTPNRGVMSFHGRLGTALPFGVPPGLKRPVT